MWGVFARLFSKNCNSGEQSGESLEAEDMDRAETRRSDSDIQDTRQAKQKASVKWLLSKAFNNKVPENLKEPFYKDHENQDHLKPQIVGALANAEMYCLALGNIYSDPNYHNLNHWSILQTLSRKGVYLPEISDSQLTETTLIQTNPLRMNAHMAVIESIMNLYAKEVLTPDRVIAAVQRFSHDNTQPVNLETHEDGLLFWVNHTNEALMKRISQDGSCSLTNGDKSEKMKCPEIPKIVELKDLCDGVALAGLISYYCSEELLWTSIKVSRLPTVSDSLHNLGLVQDFCIRCLPASVFHMLPEDVTYMRGSMQKNLVVFLADLFNLLEIHPVKCVRYPGMDRPLSSEGFPARNAHGVAHKRNIPPSVMTPIPDLRRGLDDPKVNQAFQVIRTPTHQPLRKTSSLQQSISDMSEDSLFRRGSEESFVVHRSRNIPTLSSVVNEEPLVPARLRGNKEKLNNDTKADERGDDRAAGRPSNWNENKRTYAGRRSRRNSVSDDSQLTIENFGGSQDNINFIGRNFDKEVGAHIGRKISAPAGPIPIDNPAVRSTIQDARGTLQIGYDNGFEDDETETYSSRVGGHIGRKISAPAAVPIPIDNPPIRSSIQDARGTLQLGYDNGFEKHETERENFKLKRQLSNDDIGSGYNRTHERNKENILQDLVDGEVNNRMSFADLNKKVIAGDPGGIQLVYMQQDKEGSFPSKSSFLNKTNNSNGSEKKTSFATLPNTTTWQQQSNNNQQQAENSMSEDGRGDQVMASQLNDIRMKLEEKRRHIENEKRRTEVAMNKQRQKVGKAAFLQAVVKGKGGLVKSSSDVMVDSLMSTIGSEPTSSTQSTSDSARANDKPSRPIALKDVPDDIVTLEKKWMDPDAQPFIESRKTPDMENMDLETYQKSISHFSMNSSLQDIQADIQRLASQQNQIQLAQQQQLLAQQQKQLLQQQQHGYHNQIPSYTSQQSYNPQYSQQGNLYAPLQSSASAPHIPQSLYQQSRIVPEPQFFLHNQDVSPNPQPPQRRTWAQQVPQVHSALDDSHQPELRTWGKPQNPSGFILHETSSDRYPDNRYHNGSGDHSLNHSNFNTSGFTLSQQHQLFGNSNHATPSTSPQHRQHRQLSQLMDKRASPVSLQNLEPIRPERKNNLAHTPTPPTIDDMAPQSISFIGNDEISEGLSRLNITSGSRTYRIPSPTRPVITRNSFQPTPSLEQEQQRSNSDVVSLASSSDPSSGKGFYISFDNEQPKRPKPPLRTKKGGSPKKEGSYIEDEQFAEKEKLAQEKVERRKLLERELEEERLKKENEQIRKPEQFLTKKRIEPVNQERSNASAIIIGNDLSHPDPDLIDEHERKKERILMMSLQRRQLQEESKAKKEAEAQAWREREKAKEDEKLRKKEEQIARRAAILEHHKMKKAIEDAEREGKDVDKALISANLKPNPKLRQKGSTGRPRPKTIHIDSGSVEMAEGMLNPARGKRGSNSNLTANSYNSSTMKRDYYRGSQDSLSSGLMYKDSPDDSRGMSPSHSANQTLGRRGSYKTSRDPSPAQIRGRSKYSTYQNFKGRKSNSMMNLYGSSTDQDSFAYRYGDTDSGLGRATPPRRAPSPGMGPMRHLPSPSGPGSLPGLVSKRRVFDDGSSDISSTASSMMDYNGPRLYKQPATKSNRGIMLNAVEYSVFPGVVNRDAKQRVLEEIRRSEAKHFLILFRDAGCQFRALYSFCPESEEVAKLYGTGPKQVNERMYDKFFKYNSGGKCFSVVHTKHLTVTIDAFTIHNSLWQGKKVNLPLKKDMTLVI